MTSFKTVKLFFGKGLLIPCALETSVDKILPIVRLQ